MASVYPVGSVAVLAAGTTTVLSVGTLAAGSGAQGTSAGDTIVVGCDTNSTGQVPSSVTDSKGNTYTKVTSHSGDRYDGAIFVATGATVALVPGVDTITVTWSTSTANNRNVGAAGVTGLASSPVDVTPAPAVSISGSASPALASGTLAQAAEIIISWETNGAGGGAITWSGGFTPALTTFQGPSSNQWSAMGELATSSTASVTAGGTITSAPWAVMLVGFKVAAPLAGTASLSGTSTLTAGGTLIAEGAASLAGSGSLTAAATLVLPGAATLTGGGSLAGTPPGPSVPGSALLSGGGSLWAGGEPSPAQWPSLVPPVFSAGSRSRQADATGWWYSTLGYLQHKPVLRARQATTTTPLGLSAAPPVLIPYDTVDEDPYGGWNPATFAWTPPPGYSGWYHVVVTAWITAISPAAEAALRALIGGTYNWDLATTAVPGTQPAGVTGQDTVYLIGGQDSVQGYVQMLAGLGLLLNTVSTSDTAGQQSSISITWASS